jgi:oligopeptide/dipeptide ABC transporter ATP-binding protein
MADRVAVMYAGRIVEQGTVRDIFHEARHPYTRGLLASVAAGGDRGRLQAIPGVVPALGRVPRGCSFHPRCRDRFEPCEKVPPGVTVVGNGPAGAGAAASHETRCYLYSPAVDSETLPEVRR